MTRTIAAVLVALSLLLGGAAGFAMQRLDDQPASAADDPTRGTSPTPTPSGSPSAGPTEDPSVPIIAPGRIGAVSVGMTQRELEATGQVEPDTETCVGALPYYRWKGALAKVADVLVDRQGTVVSLGVSGKGPRTASGIGVGSTYAELKAAYPALSDATGNDYGQAGVFVRDGARWIGFLFDAGPLLLRDETPIRFVEVSKGRRPGLLRDGC